MDFCNEISENFQQGAFLKLKSNQRCIIFYNVLLLLSHSVLSFNNTSDYSRILIGSYL